MSLLREFLRPRPVTISGWGFRVLLMVLGSWAVLAVTIIIDKFGL